MTREDAIEVLGYMKAHAIADGFEEALSMAIEALQANTVSREEYDDVKAYMEKLVDAFIEDGEELADSVKVVLCKDCRWYDNRYGDVCHNPRYGDGWANYPPPYVDEDYYCKDGERKGGEDE